MDLLESLPIRFMQQTGYLWDKNREINNET